MKRLLLKGCLLFLPALLVVASVNYAVDPGHLFSGGKFERAVSIWMAQGRNVTALTDFDDRLLQKDYIAGLKQPFQIIVLGSSRGMQIGSELFPGKTFHNDSVTGADMEDLMAIYEMYRSKNLTPSIAILEADPAFLTDNNPADSPYWKTVEADYKKIAGRLGLPIYKDGWRGAGVWSQLEKLRQLVSPSYFQISWLRLKRKLFNGEGWGCAPTRERRGENNIRLADGSLSYGRETRARTVNQIRAFAVRGLVAATIAPLSRNAEKRFELFVISMQNDGVKPVFFLAPFHPLTYQKLEKSNAATFESYFRNFARLRDIPVIGSYNPSVTGDGERDFYDGLHPRREAVRRIFRASRLIF